MSWSHLWSIHVHIDSSTNAGLVIKWRPNDYIFMPVFIEI